MLVRKINEDKYKEAIQLSEYAFQYKVPIDEIEKRIERMKKNHILYGILEEDVLVAKLHLLPFEIHLGEQQWKMGGIAGVATYPEYRRKGYVKELLTHSLHVMKEEGYTVSMLHPFSIPFYRKYGWEVLSNRFKCTLTKSDLVMLPTDTNTGKIKRYRDVSDFTDLSTVYDQYASTFSGMLVRSKDWWEQITEGLHAAIYYEDIVPTGYLLYSIKDSKMEVEEFVALDKGARNGLWNFICQHDSMVNTLEIITNERDPLIYSLVNPNIKMEVSPYFMTRIVNVEAFIKQYKFNKSRESVKIKITDTFAPWNEQTFLIGEEKSSNHSEEMEMTINTFSALTFGYKRPRELYEAGFITGKKEQIEKLEDLIPIQQTYFYDFF
ncbi:GNAT family N-acetyltransferase [Sutcliffiella sp. NC1]|uniref:GNAT family N-acetyltransferase n=1 Tax=Sutcliffiella sp. NC1 TaxID=3004096 RepID=UPI0022DE7A3C|nr:GNAT family N-acetyltransferase [Sutcliffiella sp. NC1]WBL15962.1 GNAT family N-acetyltransferase [Sutcliffiella sp. NC1]